GIIIAEVTIQGRRYRERFATHSEAARWAALSKALRAPAPIPGRAQRPAHPWGGIPREARNTPAAWRQSRSRSLDLRLETVTGLIGAETPISAVTVRTLHDVVEHLAGRGVSASTINRYLAAASGVLSYAQRLGYIASMPEIPWELEHGGRLHVLT